MAWILVNVSPKISSHSAGWMARVYSSVRSCRILRISTQQSVAMRLASRRSAAGGVSASGTASGSAEAAGSAPGTADIADPSLLGPVVQHPAGVVAEHVVQGGAAAQGRLQLGGGAGGPDPPGVHQRDPVAVGIGLVHIVRGH